LLSLIMNRILVLPPPGRDPERGAAVCFFRIYNIQHEPSVFKIKLRGKTEKEGKDPETVLYFPQTMVY